MTFVMFLIILIDCFYIKSININRITSLGRTMDFSFTWDGYDLLHALTNNIVIN